MYRVFCESYSNFTKMFQNEESYRLQIAKPLELLTNIDLYKSEKNKKTILYKNLSDLMVYMKENIERFPRLKAFLWSIDFIDTDYKKYGVANKEDLEEQTKLINSMLKLAYWY